MRRLSDVLDSLVDPRVGILRRVEEVRPEPGAPAFFHYAGQACDTAAFSRQVNFGATGGASADRGTAVAKAVGEAVERYCAALYTVEELPLFSAEDPLEACVPPSAFALHSAEQYDSPGFPWVPFDAATPVRWTPAIDPLTGETLYVPAAFVWIPYHYYQGSGDSPIGQPISTGLACHCSPAEAAISGICEVVERDAFTLMWQARMSMPQIRVETLSDANYDLVQRFEQTGDQVTLLYITMDAGIPTVLAVLRGCSEERPALVFAASADPSPETAARKALEELAHTRRYSQQILNRLPRLKPDPEYANVLGQIDHLNLWADRARLPDAEFVFASEERLEFDTLEDLDSGTPTANLRELASRVRAVGHRVLLADLTSPDVRALGLSVVRALIPGFHPLFMGHALRACGGSRLREVPPKLGYPSIEECGENPFPHPYP